MIVETLGDVHLGKKFETGVPLHRRGDREIMQFAEFLDSLLSTTADLHIQVGDLFDKMYVPYTVIWAAAEAYKAAKRQNPNTIYALLRGNHDASRDLDKVSAFQVFSALVRPYDILIAEDHVIRVGKHVLIPWHPVKTAAEMVDEAGLEPGDTVYGHWDIVMGDTNQLPAKQLLGKGVVRAITGHDHNQRELVMDGLDVFVTGSMQPYSHAEDPVGDMYVTRTLAEVLSTPDDFIDKCLRISLASNEVLDISIDCLQLQVQRQVSDAEGIDLGDVQFEEFDFATLFNQARTEVGLDETFGAEVLNRLEVERAARS